METPKWVLMGPCTNIVFNRLICHQQVRKLKFVPCYSQILRKKNLLLPFLRQSKPFTFNNIFCFLVFLFCLSVKACIKRSWARLIIQLITILLKWQICSERRKTWSKNLTYLLEVSFGITLLYCASSYMYERLCLWVCVSAVCLSFGHANVWNYKFRGSFIKRAAPIQSFNRSFISFIWSFIHSFDHSFPQ